MKVFIKKIKKSNKLFLVLYLLSLISYITCFSLFTINLIKLSGIETLIRVIIIVLFSIWLIVWLLVGLVTLFTKKYSKFMMNFILTLLFICIFLFCSYYIESIYSEIDNINKDTITYTSYLINLKDSEFNSDSTIGIIGDITNTEANVLAKELIEENDLHNKLNQYDDFYEMIEDLYNGKIDACFVSSNYVVLFSSEEIYENIETETKIVLEYSKELKNQDNITYSTKSLTEPFTVLVMGVDSEKDGLNANAAFNGDTLMLITFNPNTLSATMFSIPRDTYVPIACRNNALAKINSSAAYGTSCVISTIKNLTNIDIDYYVKINFKGVVDLVNVLGGITVDVEEPYFNVNNGVDYHGQVCEQNSSRQFGNNMVCMNPGVQTLNGEQALAYARNRHQYIGSDLDRIRHQQDVVTAITKELKNISSFDEFKNILNAVQKNMDTNMTTDQILSLYNVAKKILVQTLTNDDFNLSINRSYLETYSLPVYLGSSTTSALGYYESSLEDIISMMKVNLELEDEVASTSFEIDYNEDYTTKYYGKGLYNTKSVQTMPNLIGSSEEYARNWAISNGLSVNVVYVDSSDPNYNSSYSKGIVSNQSIHINTIIYQGTSLTLYVNKEDYVQITEPEVQEEQTDTNQYSENDIVIENEE